MVVDEGIILAAVLSGASGLVWLIRLEGKVKMNTNNFEHIRTHLIKVENKLDDLTDFLLRWKNGN